MTKLEYKIGVINGRQVQKGSKSKEFDLALVYSLLTNLYHNTFAMDWMIIFIAYGGMRHIYRKMSKLHMYN